MQSRKSQMSERGERSDESAHPNLGTLASIRTRAWMIDRDSLRQRCGVSRGWYPSAVRFDRISTDPERMGGVPCIRGLRFPVATVVAMVADGMSFEQILSEHPDLEEEDIREALRYAAEAVTERHLPLRPSA